MSYLVKIEFFNKSLCNGESFLQKLIADLYPKPFYFSNWLLQVCLSLAAGYVSLTDDSNLLVCKTSFKSIHNPLWNMENLATYIFGYSSSRPAVEVQNLGQ